MGGLTITLGLKWETASTRFARWARKGLWDKVFAQLLKDKKNKYIKIDSTIVRAHQHPKPEKVALQSGCGAIPRRIDYQNQSVP